MGGNCGNDRSQYNQRDWKYLWVYTVFICIINTCSKITHVSLYKHTQHALVMVKRFIIFTICLFPAANSCDPNKLLTSHTSFFCNTSVSFTISCEFFFYFVVTTSHHRPLLSSTFTACELYPFLKKIIKHIVLFNQLHGFWCHLEPTLFFLVLLFIYNRNEALLGWSTC